MEEIREYTIKYESHVEEFLGKIPKNIRKRIKSAIETRLGCFPNEYGKPLTKEWKDYRRLRIGDYRVIYKVFEETIIVMIVEIDHRKTVYD